MPPSKHRWDDVPRYRSWVKQRDRALEKMHARAQQEAADVMRRLLSDVLTVCQANFGALKHNQWGALDHFEQYLKRYFQSASGEFYQVIARMRARSYTLAKTSEAEIIAQLSRRSIHATVTQSQIHQVMHKDSSGGGALIHRISLYLDRMRRRIVSMAQASALVEEDPKEFLIDIMSAFPKKKRVRNRRILKPQLMEAEHTIGGDGVDEADIAIDNIDESEWADMLDSYMNDYVPKFRGPEYIVDLPTKGEGEYYAWEFERDMTSEFVQSVRSGQVDAANENGITDFVWIAIIDDHTCDSCCGNFGCVDFDGLLSSEIEKMTDGEYEVAPAHFNCRCTLAPATDDLPDKPDDLSKDFDSWLAS